MRGVCLLAALCRNYGMDLRENFTTMYLWTKKNLLGFGGHPLLGPGPKFTDIVLRFILGYVIRSP